jgi:hypothetical protein
MPLGGQWEIALYGRDITDERLKIGNTGDFQNKTQDQTIFDTGGNARTRGSRWGIQGSYYFGNQRPWYNRSGGAASLRGRAFALHGFR